MRHCVPCELRVAGAEALFADMGHFNRTALQVSTMTLVYPAIMASYIGQGAACCAPLGCAYVQVKVDAQPL